MKLKRVLAVLLALCMILPLAACGGNGTTTTTGDNTVVTTTVVDPAGDTGATNENGDGTVVTDENGEEVTTTVATDEQGNEITTTVATDKEGNEVTTTVATDKEGNKVTTTTKKGETTKATKTTKSKYVAGQAATTAKEESGFQKVNLPEGKTPVEKGLNFGGKTFTFAYYGTSWDQDHSDWHADFQKKYNCKLDIKGVATAEYIAGLAGAMASGKPYDIVFLYSFDYPAQITADVMEPLDGYLTTADLWVKGSDKTGGFSGSLMQAQSLNGKIYCVAGNYLQTPTVLWYNKKLFSEAGYDGNQDPYKLYKAGKWSWDALYDMLSDIKNPDKGLWGINSIAPYYEHQFINSFDTDFAKLTKDGRLVENLDDSNLYDALNMLKKYSYGDQKVTDPNNPYENGLEQFLNGTTASVINTAGAYWTFYDKMNKKTYSAFGSKANQLSNLGAVPIPNRNGVYSIWDWMGYGAGHGASEDGVKCALAFAKHDSIVNHKQAYHPNMTAEMKNLFCGILDSDNLRGPMDGFKTSAGSLGGLSGTITSAVALKGQNPTVVLKGYKKLANQIINEALK